MQRAGEDTQWWSHVLPSIIHGQPADRSDGQAGQGAGPQLFHPHQPGAHVL